MINNITSSTDDWGSSYVTNIHPRALPITKENKIIYVIVTWSLALTTLISTIGIISLSIIDKDIPQALIALGSVAVGALGSLFTHSK